MICKETLNYLQGALLIASSVIGEIQWAHKYHATSYKLNSDDLLSSYKKQLFDPSKLIDPETGEMWDGVSCDKEEDYYFSELKKIDKGLEWLENEFHKEIVGKCPNGEYVSWKIVDTICSLNDWEGFDHLYYCECSDGTWVGDLIFIPIQDEFLALFLGEMSEEARNSEEWSSSSSTPPVSVSREIEIMNMGESE